MVIPIFPVKRQKKREGVLVEDFIEQFNQTVHGSSKEIGFHLILKQVFNGKIGVSGRNTAILYHVRFSIFLRLNNLIQS